MPVTEKTLKERTIFFARYLLKLDFPYESRFARNFGQDQEIFEKGTVYGAFVAPYEYDPSFPESVRILIAPFLKNDVLALDSVLIHELCHFHQWHYGYEISDDSVEFLSLIDKFGVHGRPYNFYDKKKKIWRSNFRKENVLEYEKAYKEYAAGKFRYEVKEPKIDKEVADWIERTSPRIGQINYVEKEPMTLEEIFEGEELELSYF